MFDHFSPVPQDPILSTVVAYRADDRADKIDLGVGVYRDAQGATPIMAAVREAEARLLETETTKAYVAPVGDEVFNGAIIDLLFGDHEQRSRIRAIQTPGGSGALRMLSDLVNKARPGATIWLSAPTWPNHKIILGAAGLTLREYPYLDPETKGVDFGAMMDGLGRAAPGDVVLLHGCCHNPTGADLSSAQWHELADVLVARDLLPFVDIAYHGLGDGLEADAGGLRMLAERVPEMLVAASSSKNFALYRDRIGAAVFLGTTPKQADITRGHLVGAVRACYSMPPDHGAKVVSLILGDPALRQTWLDELDTMRGRINDLRRRAAEALRQRSNSGRFDFLADHRGLFTLTGLSPEQVAELRTRFGIYMVGDGRMNVAGLTEAQVETFADAVIAVTG